MQKESIDSSIGLNIDSNSRNQKTKAKSVKTVIQAVDSENQVLSTISQKRTIQMDDCVQHCDSDESSDEGYSDNNINDFKGCHQNPKIISKNGVFLWKITEFRQKCQEALSGKVAFLESPACYTSLIGYKYCLRLYLNGYGDAKGSYVSLFFLLMKSDNDFQLKWPFGNKLTFILRAKCPENDIVEPLIPEANLCGFSIPQCELNPMVGFSRFAKIADIDDKFIIHNSIYIQFIVH